MASWEVKGIDDFVNLCIFTEKQLDTVIGKSIHPGAKIMADAVKKALMDLPVDDSYILLSRKYGHMRKSITSRQKEGLIKSLGLAVIRKNRFGYNVKLGFDGYNDIVSEKYPKGQPNAMIARSLNSGTSFMQKIPFMDSTVAAYEISTVEAIEKEFDKQLDKLWNRDKV